MSVKILQVQEMDQHVIKKVQRKGKYSYHMYIIKARSVDLKYSLLRNKMFRFPPTLGYYQKVMSSTNFEVHLLDRWVAFFEGHTTFHFWGTNNLPFLRNKQPALFQGQKACPFSGTKSLPFLRNKQPALFEEQTACPFWATNNLPFLRDKQPAFLRKTACPFWGTNSLPFEEQRACPFWGTNSLPFLRDKQPALFEGQTVITIWDKLPFVGSYRMPTLRDKGFPFLR